MKRLPIQAFAGWARSFTRAALTGEGVSSSFFSGASVGPQSWASMGSRATLNDALKCAGALGAVNTWRRQSSQQDATLARAHMHVGVSLGAGAANEDDDVEDPEKPDTLVQGHGATGAYLMIASAHTALAISAWFQPHQAAELLFDVRHHPHILLHDPLFHLLAVGLAAGGALTAATLAGASDAGHLNRRVYQRLNLGLMALGGGELIVQAMHSPPLTPIGVFLTGVTMIPTFMVPAMHFMHSSSSATLRPTHLARATYQGLARLYRARTLSAKAYAAVTTGLLAAGAAYVLAPEHTLDMFYGTGGPYGWLPDREDAAFLWRSVGVSLLALLPWGVNLKDAAEAGKLGKPPFRALNLGLGLAALGNLAALGPLFLAGHGGPYLSLLVGGWVAVLGVATVNYARAAPPPGGALATPP